MYSFALCDDDERFSEDFEKQLSAMLGGKEIKFSLTRFDNAAGLENALDEGGNFDLIFLDVMLGDRNGVDLAKSIREKHYACDIIFISNYKDFTFDSYDVKPLHYIGKSPELPRLEAAVNRFLDKKSEAVIYLTTPRGLIALELADVIYFEVYGHELIIHKADGSKLVHRGTLREMENMLPQTVFVRTQRSFLVNLGYIKEINRREIVVATGEQVPIGRGMYDAIRLKFLDYVAKKNEFI